MPASAAWWFHWNREGRPHTGQKIGRVAQARPSVVATTEAGVWKTVGAVSHIYVLSKAKSTTTSPPLPLLSSFELFVFRSRESVKTSFSKANCHLPVFCSSLAYLQPRKKRAVGLSGKVIGTNARQGREGQSCLGAALTRWLRRGLWVSWQLREKVYYKQRTCSETDPLHLWVEFWMGPTERWVLHLCISLLPCGNAREVCTLTTCTG